MMIDVDIYPEDRLVLRKVGADREMVEPLKTRLAWIPPVGGDIAIVYAADDGEKDAIVLTTRRVYPHTNDEAVQMSVETSHLEDDVVKMLFGRDERGESSTEAEAALREIFDALGKATQFGMSEFGVQNLLEIARKVVER